MEKWSKQKQIKEETDESFPKIKGEIRRGTQRAMYNAQRLSGSSEEEALAEMKKQGFYP